jgi:hypothetical protein
MRFKAIYAVEFYDDLQENVNWYNEKQAGLGRQFYKAVKEQTAWIKKNPFNIAVRYDDVRCSKVKGFPYMVHFKVFQEIKTIKIIAVFGTPRDPAIWEERSNK